MKINRVFHVLKSYGKWNAYFTYFGIHKKLSIKVCLCVKLRYTYLWIGGCIIVHEWKRDYLYTVAGFSGLCSPQRKTKFSTVDGVSRLRLSLTSCRRRLQSAAWRAWRTTRWRRRWRRCVVSPSCWTLSASRSVGGARAAARSASSSSDTAPTRRISPKSGTRRRRVTRS